MTGRANGAVQKTKANRFFLTALAQGKIFGSIVIADLRADRSIGQSVLKAFIGNSAMIAGFVTEPDGLQAFCADHRGDSVTRTIMR